MRARRIVTIAGTALLALATMGPTTADARNGRVAAGIIGGFAAGALIGAATGGYWGPDLITMATRRRPITTRPHHIMVHMATMGATTAAIAGPFGPDTAGAASSSVTEDGWPAVEPLSSDLQGGPKRAALLSRSAP